MLNARDAERILSTHKWRYLSTGVWENNYIVDIYTKNRRFLLILSRDSIVLSFLNQEYEIEPIGDRDISLIAHSLEIYDLRPIFKNFTTFPELGNGIISLFCTDMVKVNTVYRHKDSEDILILAKDMNGKVVFHNIITDKCFIANTLEIYNGDYVELMYSYDIFDVLRFLLNVIAGRQEFAAGPPLCVDDYKILTSEGVLDIQDMRVLLHCNISNPTKYYGDLPEGVTLDSLKKFLCDFHSGTIKSIDAGDILNEV